MPQFFSAEAGNATRETLASPHYVLRGVRTEGELDIAMRSLQLSLQTCGQDEATHPKLSKEDITRVDQVRPHQPYPNPDPSPDPKP